MTTPLNFAFIHGGGQGSWVWRHTVEALQAQAGDTVGRIVLLDAPGCGVKRGRPTDALSMADVIAELNDELAATSPGPWVLVAHSQGGQAASLMSKARADLFARIIHIATSVPLPGRTLLQMMGQGLHGQNDEEVGWRLDPASTPQRALFTAMFCNDMRPDDQEELLGRTGTDQWPASTYAYTDWDYAHHGDLPATYIVCLRDQSLPTVWQATFADRFKAEPVRIDAGHQAMITRPHALAEILLAAARGEIADAA